MSLWQSSLEKIFAVAGVSLNGRSPWDVQVLDDRFAKNVLLRGSLGLGESYMRGWWKCDDLEELSFRLISSGIFRVARLLPTQVAANLLDRFVNQQSRTKSLRVVERHYDIGNDLFLAFLGQYKNYSGADFEGVESLDQAQINKMEKICRRLELKPGDRLLDVGGGWGEFARYAATKYGCLVTSINISDEQIKYATEHCKNTTVVVRKCDYRDITGSYDKIAVIAMLTHVGYKNYRAFMEKIDSCLAPDGTILIETIGGHISHKNCEAWTDKYIFPGGVIPSPEQLDRATDGIFSTIESFEFGASYVYTLRSWHRNFNEAWPRLRPNYSERTRLMFDYFFLIAAGAFRARYIVYWHLMLKSNKHVPCPTNVSSTLEPRMMSLQGVQTAMG
jgi:cyclopropane-fatty-acyl-phospholipid synthase